MAKGWHGAVAAASSNFSSLQPSIRPTIARYAILQPYQCSNMYMYMYMYCMCPRVCLLVSHPCCILEGETHKS